jgi:SPP1 family predicted phage head-tail adaptor
MGIGQRRQVKLLPVSVGQSNEGRNTETAGTAISTWAEISNPSGSRNYQNGQPQLSNTKNFLIRFRFDLHPDVNWKIQYDGKEWTVSEIQRLNEKNFYWQLTATSKADV